MKENREISDKLLTGERALFATRGATIENCIFDDGESPLKESGDLALKGCMFKWKYPLWYCENVTLDGCTFFEMARAGVWYTRNISFSHGVIEAPKNFRRCEGVTLDDVFLPHAEETLWNCSDVKLRSVRAKGDYFGMNVCGADIEDFDLVGNYGFDGVKNVTIRRARMLTKDAFWNSENVTVVDSFISGEYLGWNAKNLTLINCTIESLQGMCYIENLVMKNCRTPNTTLAFEYSSVDADISGGIDSVINPSSGSISADSIGELILDPARIDPTKTVIEDRSKRK